MLEYPLVGLLPEGNKILDQLCESRDGSIYVSGFTPHTFIIRSEASDIKRYVIDAMRQLTGFPVLADRAVCDGRHVWIWQGRQGLMLYNKENQLLVKVPGKFDRTMQRCSWTGQAAKPSAQGGIWASNGSRVLRLWQAEGDIRQEEMVRMPDGGKVRLLHETKGPTLFIATDSRLYRLSIATRQVEEVAALPASPADISVDKQGNIYLALRAGGLCRVSKRANGQGLRVARIDQTTESFLSVCTMADGTVWASTNEGHVYRYSPHDGSLTPEPLLSNPIGAAIKCIRSDGLGHLWTLTDQQVCEYAPQSHAFRIIRNSDPHVDVSYFYTLEPIDQSHICLAGAGAWVEVQSSGELSGQTAADIHPRVVSVQVGDERRLLGRDAAPLGRRTLALQELHLAADEQDITLHLTTLDHLYASEISFAYQLEGAGRNWVYLPQGSNTILLANLTKGSKRLRLMATDRYGCWSAPVDALVISRAPYWYETWWAYLLYLCLACAVGYAVYRLERRIHVLRRLIRRKSEVRLDEIELKREDIAQQQRDDDFLKKAVTKIEENLSRTDYSVEQLSSDLCMSRITLYRRMQDQTGQTPTEFIRDIRLKKAAQLLTQSPDATIADIARKVGFATPKYFSRCFKEKFGVLPKEYRPEAPKEQSH